jgi:hypothetical protein
MGPEDTEIDKEFRYRFRYHRATTVGVNGVRQLGVGRILDRFGDIVERLSGMTERFCTLLDCVDVGFIPDGILDDLYPCPRGWA